MSAPSSGAKRCRLPGPDDDATPFLLRCYVKTTSFRSLHEFEPIRRPLYEEYKLYVWRSATLRDVVTLLYMRNKTLFSPFALCSFRIVYFDEAQRRYVERDTVRDVALLTPTDWQSAMERLKDKMKRTIVPSDDDASAFATIVRECLPYRSSRGNDQTSRVKLDELDLRDGDLLDCIIHDPSDAKDKSWRTNSRYDDDSTHEQRFRREKRLKQYGRENEMRDSQMDEIRLGRRSRSSSSR